MSQNPDIMRPRRTLQLLASVGLISVMAWSPAISPAVSSSTIKRSSSSSTSTDMRFAVHPTGFNGGEPTLGVLKDGSIVAQAFENTIKSTDGGKTWKLMHTPPSGGTSLDPFVHVDEKTNRILASQLLGACQMLSLSDDGGESWIDVPTQCPSGDHQKLGSGPWADPADKQYPRSFYTCLNNVGDTACSISVDGGMTWLPQVLVFPGFDPSAPDGVNGVPGFCGGLEGDPVSGPDGSIYVPREYCGRPFVAVSKDDGLTWSRHHVAGPKSQTRPIAFGGNNPSVAVGKDGTVYYAWTGADWRHRVAFSKDQGETWSKPVVVSKKGGSTTFPQMIAGKKGAAATAFVGTPSTNKGPDAAPKESRWYLYASYSLNAKSPNARWKTVRVSKNVLQIGCIGRHGASCGNGNLLDFNDTAWTKSGRLAIVYTDGCLKECVDNETSEGSETTVAIQTRGPRFLR